MLVSRSRSGALPAASLKSPWSRNVVNVALVFSAANRRRAAARKSRCALVPIWPDAVSNLSWVARDHPRPYSTHGTRGVHTATASGAELSS